MIGRVFDNRYEIIRLLGTGGMAEVYLAHDDHLGRDVALKVLSSRFAQDGQFVERFRREASNAASLSHPNVVQIYDRGEAEGTYYIAMEYLEGHSLKDLILRWAPLRTEHVVALSTQIVEALRYAHRRDIVHRDIKPQNIIVDDEGRVKVTDFGIARAGSATALTDDGSILGTAQYLSPEQAQGGRVEASSDLYSLGVVMYEMATAHLPFTGDNPVAIAMKHVNEPPVAPRSLAPGIPENLEQVILRALAKNPEQRYITAQSFLDDLQRVQRGEPVAPAPPFAPGLDDAAAVEEQKTQAMVAVPLTAAAHDTQVRRAAPAATPAAAPVPVAAAGAGGGRGIWPWLLVLLFVLLLSGGLYYLVTSLSDPAATVDVPPLIGLAPAQAKEKAEEAGFTLTVDEKTESDTTVEPGQVARQSPEAGDKAVEGSEIRVWLAAPEQTVEVPDLVGKTQVDAVAALNGLDLALGPVGQEASERPVGEIVRQDPEAGVQVAVSSTVSIWVSSGPATVQVKVPDVVGSSQDEAVQTLTGLTLTPKTVETDSDRPAGEVVEQSPSAGTTVAEGSVVTIGVSNGSIKKPKKVPDVRGKTRAQAVVILTAQGFDVERRDREDGSVEPGTVVDQSPGPGTDAEKGSTVIIYVATAPPDTLPPTTTLLPPVTTLLPPPTVTLP